jgi:hypothetical protein
MNSMTQPVMLIDDLLLDRAIIVKPPPNVALP